MINIEELSAELTSLQIEAVKAVLTERTKKAAAEKVGISRVTLWHWLKQPAFREAVVVGRNIQFETVMQDIRDNCF